ncbi:hypothetical protein [Pedobacter sp. L105]|uniref:hypothetical protein n=1 Tax=Pedobacter sp. L105 TaxID=1641871 RepID=UPI00131E0D1C|nr:hypothetical protein [Pedobacter sp. L105]
MIRKLTALKFTMLITAFILFSATAVHAQDKTKIIGNKPRQGSSNSSSSVIKGHQFGIKMNAGRKPVELLKLDFGVQSNDRDNLKFKVNVYEFNGILSGENFVKQDIVGVIPKGKGRVSVDLEPYHIQVKKDILVTIEWLETVSGAEPSFAIGLFNGGSYQYEEGKWKRIPVAGFDFNILVRKLN